MKNKDAEETAMMINSLPAARDADKIMKYEKTVQKLILQNLAVLKKLQSL